MFGTVFMIVFCNILQTHLILKKKAGELNKCSKAKQSNQIVRKDTVL